LPDASDVLMARQPIYDKELNVYAYELLFRSNENTSEANVFDGELATSKVLLNAVTAIESGESSDSGLAFVNLTEQMLMDENIPPVPKDKVVIEILENVNVTPKLVEIVKTNSELGFTYAIDDFDGNPAFLPLFPYVKIIKIDLMAISRDKLIKIVHKLKYYQLKLLAEKIETHEEFEFCVDLGFDYFQGYFLHRPIIIKGTSIKSNDQVVLKLLAELNNPEVEPERVSELVAMDPHLSYKLLRIVNSAAFALTKTVESIKHAVVLLGLNQVKAWASMISLSSMEGKPGDQVEFILTRARFCELLADAKYLKNPSSYFTAGMLSGLDLLFGRPLDSILKDVPVEDEIKQAILNGSGSMGQMLNAVKAFEEARWLEFDQIDIQLSSETVNSAYLNAIEWVNQILHSLK